MPEGTDDLRRRYVRGEITFNQYLRLIERRDAQTQPRTPTEPKD